ncbi:hypothetical protein HAX54_047029, partial [Datura stramonium]|nr:hypothetical protein [Datura stramonium]
MVKFKAKQWLAPTGHLFIQRVVLCGRGIDSKKCKKRPHSMDEKNGLRNQKMSHPKYTYQEVLKSCPEGLKPTEGTNGS